MDRCVCHDATLNLLTNCLRKQQITFRWKGFIGGRNCSWLNTSTKWVNIHTAVLPAAIHRCPHEKDKIQKKSLTVQLEITWVQELYFEVIYICIQILTFKNTNNVNNYAHVFIKIFFSALEQSVPFENYHAAIHAWVPDQYKWSSCTPIF